ncbi:type I-F CRISPR-associated endoribonuclease Cas6/Csy4 [Shewanella algicola]|uniref:type I-F CRISPR-associated endoribonuclease Cas6/Csy4 n=1 Tax=Shewanella algicola TaxID=640633 RepID=UPI002495268A|nr:type I-F CRISPR-associated endoribonuclease Cas6/Csy4 [Shewanella algicola]
MMQWYFKTVTFLPEKRNNELLVARCLKILHGFNYRHNTRKIGVSFPCWEEQTIGRKISFVSTAKETLTELLTQPYFLQMQELEYFSISELQAVPNNCNYAMFKRSCYVDKYTPSAMAKRLRRLKRRALARGEYFDPKKYDSNTNISIEHYHEIQEHSESNNNTFRINIQMSQRDKLEGSGVFSSYGLANFDNSHQNVPFV